MTDILELVIDGPPVVWRAPYVGSHGAFSTKHGEKRIIQSMIREMYKGPILLNDLRCKCVFYIQIPKSSSKKKQQLMLEGAIRPRGGGDLTNLRKWIEDCLQGIVIDNDNQIVEGDTQKWYSFSPRTMIHLSAV